MKKILFFLLLPIMLCAPLLGVPRAVVVSRIVIDGRTTDASPLQKAVEHALSSGGFRVINPAVSLLAQYASLEKEIRKGAVPKRLSVYNADVIGAFSLSCTMTSAGVAGSSLKTVQCQLNSSVIRVENGSVIFSGTERLRGAGLSAGQAVQMIVKKKVEPFISGMANKWQKQTSGEGGWTVDVVVSDVPSSAVTTDLLKKLQASSLIRSVEPISYRGTLFKFSISGAGKKALDAVPRMLTTVSGVPLTITFHEGMVFHVQYEIGQTLNTKSDVFLRVIPSTTDKKGSEMLKKSGTVLLSSALENIKALRHTPAVLTTKSTAALLSSVSSAGASLLLVSDIKKHGKQWMQTMELIHRGSKTVIASVTAKGSNPLETIERSVSALNKAFMSALTKKHIRSLLHISKSDVTALTAVEPTVVRFSVQPLYPALLPVYRKKGAGILVVKNEATIPFRDISVAFVRKKDVIFTKSIKTLAPGAKISVKIKPSILGSTDNERYGQLKAVIRYKAADRHGVTEAYAPLLIYDKNTMNWSDPLMLAVFINNTDASVRSTATKGVARFKEKSLITKQLQKASALYNALWHSPLHYVKDPVSTAFSSEIDTVQYPWETMKRGAGDCDDLTSLLASLYESIGLATVVITVPGHVLLGVDSGLLAGGNALLALPSHLFVEKDGALFIPLETTVFSNSFSDAWRKGASVVVSNKEKTVFRTRFAWKIYPPQTNTEQVKATLNVRALPDRKQLLTTMRKQYKTSIPAWYQALYSALSGGAFTHSPTKGVPPLAVANMKLFAGQFNEGVSDLAHLCDTGVNAACYNLAVASLFAQTSHAQKKVSFSPTDAVAVLPLNVREMLLDGGGAGMGDEATATSETEKKLAEALKKAAERIKKAKEKPAFSGTVKGGVVGGRKGAKSMESLLDIAPLLFWKEVSAQ